MCMQVRINQKIDLIFANLKNDIIIKFYLYAVDSSCMFVCQSEKRWLLLKKKYSIKVTKTSETSTPCLTNESIKCKVNIDFHNLSVLVHVAIIWKQDLGGVTESRK